MIKYILYIHVFLLIANISLGQEFDQSPKIIRGSIYLDKNKDAIGDKKLKNILVSNGVEIVRTDKKGNFELQVKAGQSVFPILPSHYALQRPEHKNIQNSNFISIPSTDSLNRIKSLDFILEEQKVASSFSFTAVGDVQVDSQEELSYAAKSIFSELANRKDQSFNVFLGDLVNDKMNLMQDVSQQINKIPTASYTLVGNHDRNTKNQNYLLDEFHAHLGASHYAFNFGNVHFIVLNNVFATGKNAYEGRIDADQLTFVKNNLSHVAKDTRIVICQHIPLRATKNKNELLMLLVGFKDVLVLSGHTHTVSRHFYNNGTVHELVAGATSGTWWRGEKDIDGIPLAIMQCGTPRGYFTVNYYNNQYDFTYKAVGKDAMQQLHMALDSTKLIANIYGASDSTLVDVQINGGTWQPMQKKRMVDPFIASIVEKNKAKIYPSNGSTVLPVRARESNHIWTVDLSAMALSSDLHIKIRAKDKYGYEIEQEQIVYPKG